MKKRPIHPHTALRFRRWSHKRYAAFVSMGREVTIGHLSKGVADRSLRKQTHTQDSSNTPFYYMTIDSLKLAVLAGHDLSPEEAAWLARHAEPEALYHAAHEITRQVGPMP